MKANLAVPSDSMRVKIRRLSLYGEVAEVLTILLPHKSLD